MARSIRPIYRNVNGRTRQNCNWEPIGIRTPIVITAAEWKPSPNPADANGRPYLGEANVYVTNIGPHDPEGGPGGVEFFLHADANEPIDVQVTITVFDPVEYWGVAG